MDKIWLADGIECDECGTLTTRSCAWCICKECASLNPPVKIYKAIIRELAKKLVVNECFKLFTKDPDEIERWLLEILDDT